MEGNYSMSDLAYDFMQPVVSLSLQYRDNSIYICVSHNLRFVLVLCIYKLISPLNMLYFCYTFCTLVNFVRLTPSKVQSI